MRWSGRRSDSTKTEERQSYERLEGANVTAMGCSVTLHVFAAAALCLPWILWILLRVLLFEAGECGVYLNQEEKIMLA